MQIQFREFLFGLIEGTQIGGATVFANFIKILLI